MSIQIASLFASIGANTSGLERGLQSTKQGLQRTKSEINSTFGTGKIDTFGSSLLGTVSQIGMIAGAFTAAGVAIKKVLDFSEAGAQLEYIETKFGNLSDKIGTTADVLLNDLQKATRGTRSEMELMESASAFMSLGLTKNREDVIRLTNVAGAMNMNMGQLVLTLTNMSTMRLDQLGLSVDSVTSKFEALKATGMGEQKAWFEAVVAAGEEVIQVQGHVADTNAGAWAQMKAAEKDFFDSIKTDASGLLSWWPGFWTNVYKSMTPDKDPVYTLTGTMEILNDYVNSGRITIEQYNEALGYVNNQMMTSAEAVQYVKDNYLQLYEVNDDIIQQLFDQSKTWGEFTKLMNEAGVETGLLTSEVYYLEKGYTEAFANVTSSAGLMSEAIKTPLAIVRQEILTLSEDLANANLELDIAVKTFTQSVGGELAQGLKDAGLESGELENKLGWIDQIFGTSYKLEYQMELEMGDVLQGLLDAGSIDEWLPEAQGFIDYFAPMQTEILARQLEVDMLQMKLNNLQKDYNVRINIRTYGEIPTDLGGYVGNQEWRVNETEHAVGGPVYTNSPYIVGERGPELFVPSGSGYILTNAQTANAMDGGGNGSLSEIVSRIPTARDIAVAVRDALLLAG
jgi:hypothetical protein